VRTVVRRGTAISVYIHVCVCGCVCVCKNSETKYFVSGCWPTNQQQPTQEKRKTTNACCCRPQSRICRRRETSSDGGCIKNINILQYSFACLEFKITHMKINIYLQAVQGVCAWVCVCLFAAHFIFYLFISFVKKAQTRWFMIRAHCGAAAQLSASAFARASCSHTHTCAN